MNASTLKPRTFLIFLFLPAALCLLARGVFREQADGILRVALVGIAVFSLGAGWRAGIRPPPGKPSGIGLGLAVAGLIFAGNLFVLFLGCASPPAGGGGVTIREYRPAASSRKEMAKVARQIPTRAAGLTPEALDLAPYYNATLTEEWQTKVGPANLASLPAGGREFAGITFDVRGVIRICSQPKEDAGRKFPVEVSQIRLDRMAHRLHFLHGFGWEAPALAHVATYVIHYADGQTASVPVVFGRDVLASWSATAPEEAETKFVAAGGIIAWKNSVEPAKPNPAGAKNVCRLFLTTWQNPRPSVKIESLELQSNRKIFATPFLLALTMDSKE